MKKNSIAMAAFLAVLDFFSPNSNSQEIAWKHLSTTAGDLPVPNSGKEQTSSLA